MEHVPSFFSRVGINVETYDLRTHQIMEGSAAEGDVEFYRILAEETGGPVLELGSGTGRVTWALAEAGIEIVGLELQDAMQMAAEARRWKETTLAQQRASFESGDMREFDLGREFSLVLVPYRGFQALLDTESQRACLRSARRHLCEDGLLVIHVFDPRLELLIEGSERQEELPTLHDPFNDNIIEASIIQRQLDRVHQVLREVWKFTELDGTQVPIRQEEERLELRWTSRHEMRLLFELEGFEVDAEYSDFEGSDPVYGAEQIWIVRKTKEER